MELSKEEKEAIEKFREYIDYCENNKECREELKQCFGCTIEVEEINAMKIVLNLIEKLQQENEKQEKVIDKMAKALHLYVWTDYEKIMITFSPKENCHSLSIGEIKQYFYELINLQYGTEESRAEYEKRFGKVEEDE